MILAYLFGILGSIVGAILFVFTQHFPEALQKNWHKQCLAYIHGVELENPQDFKSFWKNIFSTPKAFYASSALLSGMLLGFFCGLNFWYFSDALQASAYTILFIGLFCLAFIDAKFLLLPDFFTLSLLWIGLGVSLIGSWITPESAILGAMAGYIGLATVNGLFYCVRKRQGFGRGDFKLLAALGAWLGYAPLLHLMLFAALSAVFVVGTQIVLGLRGRQQRFGFGPYLAFAGVWMIFY